MTAPARCKGCRRSLVPTEHVYQLARGTCIKGFITPTYQDAHHGVIWEWHDRCLNEFPLREQHEPYSCSLCGEAFPYTADVMYLVLGYRPSVGYMRPEHRGYTIHFVAHRRCFAKRYEAMRY